MCVVTIQPYAMVVNDFACNSIEVLVSYSFLYYALNGDWWTAYNK